uniref:TOG domain-containing protein n=1 Tax=Strigamia maritima TaxID=126957 RepID=T1JBF4_STRMM
MNPLNFEFDFDDDDDDYDYGDKPEESKKSDKTSGAKSDDGRSETTDSELSKLSDRDGQAEEAFTAYRYRICEDERQRNKSLDLPEPPEKIEPWDQYEESYDDEIELTEEIENIPLPVIDPARTQLSYGMEALPKLNREIRGPHLNIRQTALIQLCSYLYNPEHIDRAKKCGIIETLKVMLLETDTLVRIKAAECIKVIASYSFGLQALLSTSILIPLNKLLDDECMAARKNINITICSIATVPQGVRAILHNKLVNRLLNKLRSEKNFIQTIILDTLHLCLQDDVRQALESHAMSIFKEMLDHTYPIIRAKTARVITDLSVFLQGKMLACATHTVPVLIKLLNDDHPLVKAKAASALMMITIITKGKYTALDNKVIETAIPLLPHEKFEVRLNILKIQYLPVLIDG